MKPRRPDRHSACSIAGMATLALLAPAVAAWAQPGGQGARSGGLLPTREVPSASGRMTRDELLQKFDLDANGRIDEAEAEAARARMRRDRIDTMQNSGLDPLTGRPRGAPAPRDEQPRNDDLLLVPGTPTDQPPPRKPAGEAERKPAPTPPSAVPSGRAPAMTGGVRAGAPAVRPGYGATGPKQDLNAGRPREPRPLPAGALPRTGPQPAGRPTATTPAQRATTPRPGLFPQGSSRPTAEDIGR